MYIIIAILVAIYFFPLLLLPFLCAVPVVYRGAAEQEFLKCRVRILDSHLEWLNTNVPTCMRPYGQHGFNMSLTPYKGSYLCCIRFFNTCRGLCGEEIIPGNKPHQLSKHHGKNFIWNCWQSKGTVDASVIFECDFDGSNIIPRGPISTVENVDTFHKETRGIPYSISDIRLFVDGETPYIYDSFITVLKDIEVGKEIMEKITYTNKTVCEAQPGYEKKYDKNWAWMSTDAKAFNFMHWFEADGVYAMKVYKNYNYGCKKVLYAKFNADVVPALGNNKLPMFSFSTPFTDTPHGKLALGHCKIITTYNYNEDSKIYKFREKIKASDGNYVQHNSYLYLGYFILLKDDKMFLSDAFLPIPAAKYKFSIYFPMSVFVKDGTVYSTGGYGDFYNVLVSSALTDVVASCKHDVSNFHAEDYAYHVI